ncbi:uncharacterized protein LOC143289153 [Babylonia areolata]|uniref:uncharacterized protein LOC143289153 n=1 Tax=Babylonia areolata TaxID=304850 RepID=UPI003FD3F5BC
MSSADTTRHLTMSATPVVRTIDSLYTPTCFLLLLFSYCLRVPGVEGHGRLLDPPSRSSMWRVGFNNSPPNYDDNQLFCGGVQVQWGQYNGKCGLCGDPWPGPRDNEPGGKYANGIITRKYREGQVIEVHVQLTANHRGYFEFRLCQHDNPFKNITQKCLDQHLLTLDNTGERRYKVPDGPYSATKDIYLKLRLPDDVKCSACVLQWKYNAGNSWGTNLDTGESCIGCGPQEQFYACADVAIGREEVSVGVAPDKYPWYFQKPDSEWHYGIAYVFSSGGTGAVISGSAAPRCGMGVVVLVGVVAVVFGMGH